MKYIALHHSITDINMSPTRALDIIEQTHINNFGYNPSQLSGSHIGYNFTIDKNGKVYSHRKVGEETMAQKGYNLTAVSICLLMDGDRQMPSTQMIEMAKTIIKGIRQTEGNIPVKPHRWFTGGGSLCQFKNDKPKQTACPHKSCCGLLMSDKWIDDTFNNIPIVNTPPKVIYTKCELGDISENVDRIQDSLVSQGFLARKNPYKEYDEAMAEAVNKYQTKNNIGTWAERRINQGAYIGPKTLLVLNR